MKNIFNDYKKFYEQKHPLKNYEMLLNKIGELQIGNIVNIGYSEFHDWFFQAYECLKANEEVINNDIVNENLVIFACTINTTFIGYNIKRNCIYIFDRYLWKEYTEIIENMDIVTFLSKCFDGEIESNNLPTPDKFYWEKEWL